MKNICCFAVFLVVVLTMCGCLSVGPDYKEPKIDASDSWSQAVFDSFNTNAPEITTWWTLFDDETLNKIILMSSTNNPDLQIAAERIAEAAALRGYAKSDWYPQISADGSITRLRASKAIFSTLPEGKNSATQYSIGGSLGWELDLWGRVRRMVESSEAAMQASVEDYRDTLVILYAEIAYQYMQVREIQTRIRLAEESVTLQQDTLNLTMDRNKAGLAPDLDVYQSKMNLAQTKSMIPPLRILLAKSVHRLGVLVGEEPSYLRDILVSGVDIPVIPDSFAVGVPVNVVRQRPDVRSAERRLASQSAMIGARKAELYPTFTLPGTLALQAYDAGQLDSDALTYGIGPSFRWNLFNGGRIRSLVTAEEARTKQAEINYQRVVLGALEEVENAMVSLKEGEEHIKALQDSVDAASKSVDLVRSLYKSGLTDFQNVLSTESAYTVQRDNLAAAEGSIAKYAILLYKALGGGWSHAQDIPSGSEAVRQAVVNNKEPEEI
jgi:NodT family efflux transporter outer membrane factor (OMF) lipoprotein